MSEGSLINRASSLVSRSSSYGTGSLNDLMLKRQESSYFSDGGGEFHLKYEPKEVLGR